MEHVSQTWTVGPYVLSEIKGHSFREFEGQALYRVAVTDDAHTDSELYLSLDHALAASIARRWTGSRGAGGTAVGTAADWFMTMIGAVDPQVLPARVDEVNERRRRGLLAQIAERERKNLLRRAAANPVRRTLARGSDDLLG